MWLQNETSVVYVVIVFFFADSSFGVGNAVLNNESFWNKWLFGRSLEAFLQ